MASIAIGKLDEFNPRDDSITAYVERVTLYFQANGIEENKQVAVFLSAIGAKTYSLLRNLTTPALPKDKTFVQLVEILKTHFEPRPLVIAERFNFHKRAQKMDESVRDFAAELRRLTIHCVFGEHLDEALRDRFVCGLTSETIQKRLLTEKELTFSGAIEIAQGMEAAAQNARKLQETQSTNKSEADICKLSTGPGEIKQCYKCGQSSHRPTDCPYKSATCHGCGKQGHLKRMCRQTRNAPRELTRGGHPVKMVDTAESVGLYAISEKSVKPFIVDLKLDGKPFSMELDTGATVSLVSAKTFHQLFPGTELQPTTTQLHSYAGESIPVKGQVEVEVKYGQQSAMLPLVVVNGEGPSLFGRDWMMKIQLDWKKIYTVADNTDLMKLLDRYRSLFEPGLGQLKDYKAKIQVDPQAKPRFCKARSVPYAMKDKIDKELDQLEKDGIIEKVQYADWAAPIVPVLKADGNLWRFQSDSEQSF